MLAPMLLVTVCGPCKTLDLELPGDVAVGELIPLLLEICGCSENKLQKELEARFNLQVSGARAPLPRERTLIDADICNGAVLMLQTSHPVESFAPRQFTPKSVRPAENTGGIGVTWESLE